MLIRFLCGVSVLIAVATAAPSQGHPTPKSSAGHLSPAAADLKQVDKHEVESYRPYTYYAKAAYCGVATKKSWDCGDSCKQRSNFKLINSGGDGNNTQFWFVGYDPDLKTVVVSHQGTDPDQKGSVATDLDTRLVGIDQTLFPHASSKIMVHHGFSVAHARAAKDVLAAVKKTQSTYKDAKKITLVGHSLGAALSLLDALYLSTAIPHVAVSFIGYGMPRAGNKDFASFVDSTLKTNIVRINNKNDPVPTLPGS
ncbi:hypothetical protein ONZ45_g18840 [Pleurotus djamor]|nr:hypothetical protein ONZ45_g18840 [Pleurotus djamor]